MSEERLHAVVHGTVQGVGFRYFVIQRARARGLRGYVANLRGGSVEVVAEGARDRLEQLLSDLNEGPRYGVVRNVTTEWLEASGSFDGFDVRFRP
jgi:acylphosphatase